MKYLIETYGCQMNKAESSALEQIFRERGWEPARLSTADLGLDPPDEVKPEASASKASLDALDADLVLINTCSVRATAETRAWGRIDLFASLKRRRALQAGGGSAAARPLTLVVTGCMAERLKRRVQERQPAVDYVVGTFQKQAFGLLLDAVEQGRPALPIDESPAFVFARSYYEPGSFRSFVPIMHGCDNFCSYCIVPFIRGREVSRKPSSILAEIAALEDSGVREITLLGQNVNSYSWSPDAAAAGSASGSAADPLCVDPPVEPGLPPGVDEASLDFPGLLRLISAFVRGRGQGGIHWVRFLTSHPKDLSAEVIAVLAEDRLFCRHVHLCAQSGSDAVLKAMNRRYSRESYLDLVDRLKAAVPGLSISTDILVGFPGETEDDLEQTLDLMRRVPFSYSFMYHFNPREGTPAAVLPGRIGEQDKRRRLARVIQLQKELTRTLMESRLGQEEEVLIEGPSRRKKSEVLARTQRDEMVVFPAALSRVGSFATVRLASLSGTTFVARELEG